jgi:hypothetical protein
MAVYRVALNVFVNELEERLGGTGIDFDGEIAAEDTMEAMVGGVEAGCAAGVGIGGGAAAEFMETGIGVDGVVLPVAVATDGDEVMGEIVTEETADRGAFGGKGGIGVVVFLRFAIGADEGIGVD